VLWGRVQYGYRFYLNTMRHSDFVVGETFWCGEREWRCTDIGSRTVVAICLDDAEVVEYSPGPPETKTTRTLSRDEREARGWFRGPLYAVVENVFDEYDVEGCSATREPAESSN
jgi:hypothetical protein